MEIIHEPRAFAARCREWVCAGDSLALTPTMGYLHAGHASLIDWARANADKVAVTIFVNPTQFGPNEDLEAYPRSFTEDCEKAEARGADVVFAPSNEAMYAPDHATWVEAPTLAEHLCGRSRPVHFRGVATVVSKLFNLSMPTYAVFGQKDWQQLALIKRMARDMNYPVTVVGRPTVRESDGLAMSSRNAYLTSEERAQAPGFYKALTLAAESALAGETDPAVLRRIAKAHLERHVPLGRIDYLEVMHPETIQPLTAVDGPVLLAGALHLGKARLIDNICVDAQSARGATK